MPGRRNPHRGLTMTAAGKARINGQQERTGDPDLEVFNPADSSIVGVVPDMPPPDVSAYAERLRAAQPAWEAFGPEGRGEHLRNWLNWIVDNQDRILGLVHREAGKSWGDAQIELLVCMEVINYFTKRGADFLADET